MSITDDRAKTWMLHGAYHAAIADESAHTAMFAIHGTSFSPVVLTAVAHGLTWPGETTPKLQRQPIPKPEGKIVWDAA